MRYSNFIGNNPFVFLVCRWGFEEKGRKRRSIIVNVTCFSDKHSQNGSKIGLARLLKIGCWNYNHSNED
jgi:hypothetical protein